MRRRWIIPFAIFIILILAFIFRWDYGPTTTYNSGAFKVQHKVDRWTGRPWVVLYGAIDNETYSNCEIPRTKTGLKLSTKKGNENARKERDNVTRIWFVFLAITSGLLIYYFAKDNSRKKINVEETLRKISRKSLLNKAYTHYFTNGGKYLKFVFDPSEIEKLFALKYLADKRLIKRRLVKQDSKEIVYEATITAKGIDVVENDIPLSDV
jgi:hypothetical protein